MLRKLLFTLAGATLLGGSGWALAQAQTDPADGAARVYRREVFSYARGGRPDPFVSLSGSAQLGTRFEDLTLVGTMTNPDPNRSVATIEERNNPRRFRVRIGQRIGGVTVVAIHPRRVDVVIEEFGVVRRESLPLKAKTETKAQP